MYPDYFSWLDRDFEVEELVPLIDSRIIDMMMIFIDKNEDLVSRYDYIDLLSGILEYYHIYGKLSDKQRLSISLFIYDMDELYNEVEEYIKKF
jgi:hypothetical protein